MPDEATEVKRLVVYCDDHRAGLRRALEEHFPDGKSQFLGWLGGAILLTMPTECDFAMKRIKDALWIFPDIPEIVLAGHICGFYGLIRPEEPVSIVEQREDLRKAAKLPHTECGLPVTCLFGEGLPGNVCFPWSYEIK